MSENKKKESVDIKFGFLLFFFIFVLGAFFVSGRRSKTAATHAARCRMVRRSNVTVESWCVGARGR